MLTGVSTVRKAETILSLPSILSSLSQSALSNHLATIRRDITAHFIDHVLKQPTSILEASTGDVEHKLSLVPSPPNEEIRTKRLNSLATILTSLSTHFFSALPPSQRMAFTRSLCKPVTNSILNNLLITFLPSSFDQLPSFMELVKQAVHFEEQFIIGILGNDPHDRPVKAWADGVSGHYERQRRSQILEASRAVIISPEDLTATFLAEVDILAYTNPTAVPVQVDNRAQDEIKEDAWGFDNEATPESGGSLEVEEDGWGFDDDVTPDPDPKPEQEPELQHVKPSPSPEIINADDEPDPSEAWGWNDDDAPPTEETAWDDPWADEPSTPSSSSVPSSPINVRPPQGPPIASPKVAG